MRDININRAFSVNLFFYSFIFRFFSQIPLEAAGVEPASNKVSVKASTDIVCFFNPLWFKNKQKPPQPSFLRFSSRGEQKADSPGPILLNDVLGSPAGEGNQNGSVFLRCER